MRSHFASFRVRQAIVAGLVIAASTIASCRRDSTGPGSNGTRVLFVGNSLTYSNSLPELVRSVALLMGDTITVHMEAAGSTALIDHLNGASNAVGVLASNSWNTVVLQQGPTPRGICRDSLVLWTQMFDPLIKRSGARTALMMTWPSKFARPDLFDEVRVSFQQAAGAVHGTFLPAGEAWRIAWSEDPALPLYSGDDFHPSALGSLLAALEIHGRLSGRNLHSLPAAKLATIAPAGTSLDRLQILINSAQLANELFPASPGGEVTIPFDVAAGTIRQTC
jgi:hypothetical protein